jgi:hypothetical protein
MAARRARADRLHLRLIRAVAELLGVAVTELRLTQSDVWPKYGAGDRPPFWVSPYWTTATIDAVEARYGVFGMNMTPYRQALDS